MFAPLIALFLFVQQGPPDFGGAIQVEKMKPIQFLVGNWKGSGFYLAGERKIEVECSERVESAAGGTCLLIVGKHFMKGPNDQKLLIHDTAAMVRFDPNANKHRILTQLANGLGNDFELNVVEKGFDWGHKTEIAGTTRYTMTLTEKGEWFEIGERSTDDGKTWTKFLEMRMSKV